RIRGRAVKDGGVRGAITHAVDVDSIIQNLFNGNAERVNSLVGNVEFGYDPSLPPVKYDVEQAKALLREAGYAEGFKATISAPNGAYVLDNEVAEAVAGFLAELGIDCDVNSDDTLTSSDLAPSH